MANRVKVNIRWLDSEMFETDDDLAANREPMHGILVPGGFGERGSEGKIASARFAPDRNVPFLARQSAGEGKTVSVTADIGGRRITKKKDSNTNRKQQTPH